MFDALRAERSISSKSVSYGIWYPGIARVHVTTARGIHFANMGHSIARADGDTENASIKPAKRLELLPEEAIYLIERGALFCCKFISTCQPDITRVEETSPGAPMAVQQAYAEMIGRENMTLERYQVYAYLKRLGFVLTRAKPPSSEYPTAPPLPRPVTKVPAVWKRIAKLLSCCVSNVLNVIGFALQRSPWKPVDLRGLKSSGDIFAALRFLRCGHAASLYESPVPKDTATQPHTTSEQSPYTVFFHVYKPSTPFRKTAPPAPDFYVVVINARTTPMPSLYELSALFEALPEMPPPPPRKRGIQASNMKPTNATAQNTALPLPTMIPVSPPSFLRCLFSYFPFGPRSTSTLSSAPHNPAPNKPNPFVHLKAGKKSVVIAAVDSGNISFFRFGEGAFHDWPMV
ncbi:tRNA-splicing endonuclease subunit sen54 N-term-domain-containing protein [Scleroderma yunnanense]